MVEKLQAIRGMNDVLPEQIANWQMIESTFAECVAQYDYQEIRFPVVESTALFKRSIGEVTDIVEKEMYTFTDLNGDSLTLRPEGTAGCVRACIEHGLLHNQLQRLWYHGPMFRHEKPQKGRYRQFYQFGIEAFGMSGAAIEIELIAMSYRFWQMLGLEQQLELQVNSLGELQERQAYRDVLIDYFKAHYEKLDEDSKRRLERNPLRILDSKNPEMQQLIKDAPTFFEHLGEESRQHFNSLCRGLEKLNIPYKINPFLVRGLDYYSHTVFEWVTDKLGAQATVCAGGRYDSLVEQLGGRATPAVGFAMGQERLLLLLETLAKLPQQRENASVYIISDGDEAQLEALLLAEKLRSISNALEVICNTSGGSFKSQFKKADKSGARFALILGQEELANKQVSVKDLRAGAEQVCLPQNDLQNYLQKQLAL